MERLAVLLVDSDAVTMHVSLPAPLGDLLEQACDGDVLVGWRFQVAQFDAICAVLDRRGYRWAADRRIVPRTWAEHLFAELPVACWEPVQAALCAVLGGSSGDCDQLAVLQAAWAARQDWDGDGRDVPLRPASDATWP